MFPRALRRFGVRRVGCFLAIPPLDADGKMSLSPEDGSSVEIQVVNCQFRNLDQGIPLILDSCREPNSGWGKPELSCAYS